MLRRLHLLQIDSVNVLTRAHYMPLFSRLGPYDRDALDGLAYRERFLFEYWGHEASLLLTELYPLFRWRMDRSHELWSKRWASKEAIALLERVFDEVATRGPIGVSDLDGVGRRSGPWWGWAPGKAALEHLFADGRITTADRRNFERRYDLVERVVPADLLAMHVDQPEAHRRLLIRAADALGVATLPDLADYFRLKPAECAPRLAELLEGGDLLPVTVEGWRKPAYMRPGAPIPRAIAARALLSPFDPVVWARERTERIFGFRYRIEIYVPEPKREFGYYVLPFLLNEDLVARVDIKADRAASRLWIRSAWLETGRDAAVVAAALAQECRDMASWLGLEQVHVDRRGTLATALRAALR